MPVHYSHMKLAARQVWGEAPRVLDILNAARAEGIDITGDIYPYEYWQSTITVLLPNRDPSDIDEINFVLESIAPADGIIFTNFMPDPSYVGLSIADIAELRGSSEAQTLSEVIDLLLLCRLARGWLTGPRFLPGNQAAVVIKKISGIIWAQAIDNSQHAAHTGLDID